MAYRSDDSGPQISLFPFLSVLCCVMGVLTLMIVSQVIDCALATVPEEPPGDSGVDAKQEELEKELAALKERREALRAERKLLAPVEETLDGRHAQAENALRVADMERKKLDEAIKDAKDTILRLRDPGRAPERPPTAGSVVELIPDATGAAVPKRPVVVECVNGRLRLHTLSKLEAAPVPGLRVQGMRFISDAEFQRVLASVDVAKEYLLLVVRQNGVEAYNQAVNAVAEHKKRRPDFIVCDEPLPDDYFPNVPLVFGR